MRKRIIAVDPGARHCGVTIFHGSDIMVSMVRNFQAKAYKDRIKEVRKVFLSFMGNYAPSVIVIEKPFFFWSERSKYLTGVVNEIKRLSKNAGMEIYEYSPRTVRKAICDDGNATKQDEAKVVYSAYPELKIYLKQDKKYKEIYWGHMFDSVGLGICYLRQRHGKSV
ncbi:hypothetical protein A2242_04915 [Candidatus Falkowbacteria bacterium RIFOXYA2_FULL_47_9]|uniref:Uncharacterized protein n=1 Tax=Candidatus Falkowbacteria bacterium RIFOXYA2_FULL_47_9 TaxID=1797995 RepID=A0A1F5SLF9_9BACT|nr:MAG: hypothetical protein A2242_04915 [Candidatus Falkowbacteria bacterium RIFOXYA2_FULL_47_9]OGS24554.1 MAG: hypothetical protein A2314_07050 [Elusimicrobia bacterium RIFOXYB2_FULL_50_12]